MANGSLKDAVRLARDQARKLDNHYIWSAIFDAEALLAGRRSVLSQDDVERELFQYLYGSKSPLESVGR